MNVGASSQGLKNVKQDTWSWDGQWTTLLIVLSSAHAKYKQIAPIFLFSYQLVKGSNHFKSSIES